jgi:tRNA A-37 threonylcarbamoyl transferase component Bud32
LIGRVVADRYEVQEVLGSGGMASVYRAHDKLLERSVALKVLHEHFSRDPEYVERFRREARAIARVSHPNIVTVIDRGTFEGHEYIVFEHVRGATLKDILRREGPLPAHEALSLAHQVARALAFAHEQGIVHRDVKPHNVLVDEDGGAKVTDFGLARSRDLEQDITQTGTVMGTSDYISPEQASGGQVDERADQYAIGVLLYELLAGEVPYPADNYMAAAVRHMRDPVPSIRERRRDVSPRVDELIQRAMAKRPEDRFPTTEALVAALQAALAEEPGGKPTDRAATQVVRPVARPRQRRPPKRSRAWFPLLLGLIVLAAGAALLGFIVTNRVTDENSGAPVSLEAISDFDPEGGDGEHPEAVPAATDGDTNTFWTTETYNSFSKSGVGIVLNAGRAVDLDRIEIVSDEPGFTALIRAGDRPDGGFVDVSDEETVNTRTVFRLEGSEEHRYYVVWITDPNGRAHVNEVRAG